jgi:capsular polysaccharide biosynthesis protein
VRRLHIVPCTRWALAYRETHAAMFERMIARATATAAPAAGPLRLCISRGDRGLRPIANEPDLCAALERRGFRVVEMGGLPLVEQIALIRRARRIVAPHGAGLSHLIFAQPGCRVLEIFPASIGTRPARIAMTRISRVFGHRHALWLETGEGVDEGWNVSLDPLLAHLDGA